jgi:hypothetical protein
MIPIQNPYANILQEIETALWEHDFLVDEGKAVPFHYDDRTFRACLKILMSGMIWKQWDFLLGKPQAEKEQFSEELGKAFRALVLKYTGIDPQELYEENHKPVSMPGRC